MIVSRGIAFLLACSSSCAFAGPCHTPFPAQRATLAPLLAKAKSALVEKDEFETTAAFMARQQKAAGRMSDDVLAIAWPGVAATSYNADTETVSVSRYDIERSCFVTESSVGDAVKAATFKKPAKAYGSVTIGSNYCVTNEVSRVPEKSYTASNSYGASVLVHVSRTRDEGLFLGYGETGQSVVPGDYPAPAFSFRATADEARTLKTTAQIVWLVKPRAPFYAKGTYYLEPKIDSPTELYGSADFLVVDPICVGLFDRLSGKMFDSFAVDGG